MPRPRMYSSTLALLSKWWTFGSTPLDTRKDVSFKLHTWTAIAPWERTLVDVEKTAPDEVLDSFSLPTRQYRTGCLQSHRCNNTIATIQRTLQTSATSLPCFSSASAVKSSQKLVTEKTPQDPLMAACNDFLSLKSPWTGISRGRNGVLIG